MDRRGVEPRTPTCKAGVFPSIPTAHNLAESRGVEPHPISENLVFKASRRTIPAALLSNSGGECGIRTHVPFPTHSLAGRYD